MASMNTNALNSQSVIPTALAYGIGAVAVGCVGIYLTAAATATMVKLAGIGIIAIASASILGILITGITHAGDPKGFKENVHVITLPFVAEAVSTLFRTAAQEGSKELIRSLFRPNEASKQQHRA